MKLLLLGSGGREHALAWKIAQSPKIEKLYIAPGNAGTSEVGENVAIKADDFAAIKEFVVKNDINMVVVGPEDPLVKGIYDYFKNDEALKNVPVIGPSKAGAVLEGSKEFAKGFMQRHHIPTAGYKSITAANLEEGLAFLETLEAPYVLKADGLCAGKGVLILPTLEEAKKELKEMLSGMFGDFFFAFPVSRFSSDLSLRSTFFTSSPGGSCSGTIPRCRSMSRTAALLSTCSFPISCCPYKSFCCTLTEVISAAKSLALILIVGKKSANGRLSGAPNFLLSNAVSIRNKALSPFERIRAKPLLSTPRS